jgi:hypothetical protein
MDLLQTKLTKSEWDNIDLPVSADEKQILKLIMLGFENTDICINKTQTMVMFLKMQSTENINTHLCHMYFVPYLNGIYDKMNTFKNLKKNKLLISIIETHIQSFKSMVDAMVSQLKQSQKNFKLNNIDVIKIKNLSSKLEINKKEIFEFILLQFVEQMWMSYIDSKPYVVPFYTIITLLKNNIVINKILLTFIQDCIKYFKGLTPLDAFVFSSVDTIEKNPHLFKYKDITLYPHQKQLFSILNNQKIQYVPKLILYIAPTGTGKTQSPIGLLSQYRIIYLCAARHVGLALAKSALSSEKKVAFAFGCTTASDIRLHYSASHTFTKDYRSGGIYKVDNSIGTKVEIMICDIQSYIIAMHYMLAFNDKSNIVTMWDEPTITMDVESHDLHELIHKNWSENLIETVILSCATLPKEHEIFPIIQDFQLKFENAVVYNINTYDCQKSISIMNKDSKVVLPHHIFTSYSDIMQSINYCYENKSLLRYFDLTEILNCIKVLHQFKYISDEYSILNYFKEISEISMETIKLYYLHVLRRLTAEQWDIVKAHIDNQANSTGEPITRRNTDSVAVTPASSRPAGSALTRIASTTTPVMNPAFNGILLTTVDAHTLTDGPTLYLTENIAKMGQFYISQTNIPSHITTNILNRIHENTTIQQTIQQLQKELEEVLDREKDDTSDKQLNRGQFSPAVRVVMQKIENIQDCIKPVSLDTKYVPNTIPHQMLWNGKVQENSFTPNISEDIVCKIMLMDGVDINDKLLLLLGIGVFKQHPNVEYLEIMKQLCVEQKLYLIIAHSDYIYGLNYQCCHGFIGKDLTNMTHQKILQSLGRVGRGNTQQTYTVRFRENESIQKLFSPSGDNLEAIVMNRLFSSQ